LSNTGVQHLVKHLHCLLVWSEESTKEERAYCDKECAACPLGIIWQPSSPVPTHKVQHTADDQVRQLRNDQASDEWHPVIGLTLLLTRLIHIATINEDRLKLGDETGGDKQEAEDREEVLLEIADAVTNRPERKAIVKRQKYMQDELVVDVLGVAEQGDVHSVRDKLYLLPNGRCELMAIVNSPRRFGGSIGNKSVKLLGDLLVFWRIEPDLVPVLALRKTS